MPSIQLTDVSVRALKPPERGQETHWDKSLRGFGVRISQGGTKTFVLVNGANRQRTTIGRYPTITLSEARQAAKRILAERTLGKTRPKVVAWDDAMERFLSDCEERNRPNTVKGYRRLLKKHFAFGRRHLSDIGPDDISHKLDRLKHAPAERNHALVAVKIFLGWVQKPPRRYIPHNPCEEMVPTKRPSRKHVLSDPELHAVYETARRGNDSYSAIVALLILTGQRRGEIGSLRHSWIDSSQRTITIPGSVAKNGLEHTFPYGDLVAGVIAEVLERIPEESDCLFPASREHVRGKPTTSFNGWAKAKPTFDKLCGVTGWTLHDLRRVFATNLAALGVMPHVIERLLNHKFGSLQSDGLVSAVAEIYNRHRYLPEMRAAVALWEKKLTELPFSP